MFRPSKDTIHTVVVVPMFEPKIRPIAPLKVISSALKKDMTIMVRSDELCTTDVAKKPEKIAFGRFDVLFLRIDSKAPPLKSLKPSSIKTIPTKNIVTPAIISFAFSFEKIKKAKNNKRKVYIYFLYMMLFYTIFI
jgi:hypothetical protein